MSAQRREYGIIDKIMPRKNGRIDESKLLVCGKSAAKAISGPKVYLSASNVLAYAKQLLTKKKRI